MNNRILITGATGTVGNEVINQLSGRGFSVKAAARNRTKAESMGWESAEIVDFDYERPESFEEALADVGQIFVVPPPVNPKQAEMVVPLIEQAAQKGVRRIVNLSAMGVEYSDAPLRQIEEAIEKSGVAYTLLRPNWFMQNFNISLLETIERQNAIYLPAGDAKTSFIDIRDIAAVAVAMLTTEADDSQAYTLTGGQALDHYELAKMISDVSGRTIEYVPMSDEAMRAALEPLGWPKEAIDMFLGLYAAVRQGGTATISPAVSDILGRQPISFQQYARDHADYWTKN